MWSNIYDSHFTDYDPNNADAVAIYDGIGENAGMAQQIGVFGVGFSWWD